MIRENVNLRNICFLVIIFQASGSLYARDGEGDYDYDLVIFKGGVSLEVDLEERPLALDPRRHVIFTKPDGSTVRKNTAQIARIEYREQRQINELIRLYNAGQYDDAQRLIIPLHYALQSWPVTDTTVDWGAFRIVSARLEIAIALVTADEGMVTEAIERLDDLRPGTTGRTDLAEELQAGFEQVFLKQAKAAVERQEWWAAEESASELLRRYPQSEAMKDIISTISGALRDLLKDALAAERDGRFEAAERLMRKAYRIRPRDGEARRRLHRLQERFPILRCGVIGTLTDANPYSYTSYTDAVIGRLCFRSLFRRQRQRADEQHAQYVGDLASRWRVNECGNEIEIYLRPDLVWSDGTPLTAHDVAYTLRVLASRDRTDHSLRLSDIFEDATEPESPDKVVLLCRVQPPCLLATLCLPILPRHRPNQRLLDMSAAPYVVSGALQPERASPDELVLVPNVHYTSPNPAVQRMVVRFFQDRSEAVQALANEDLQLLAGLSQRDVNLAHGLNSDLIEGATRYRSLHYLGFNNKRLSRASAADARSVRKAIASVIDREAAATEFVGGEIAAGLFPADSWARTSRPRAVMPAHEPEAAAETLAERPRSLLSSLRFVYPDGGVAAAVCQRFISNMEQAGLTIVKTPVSASEFRRLVYDRRDFDIAYATYLFVDESYDIRPLLTLDGAGNFMGIRDSQLVKVANQRQAATDRSAIREHTQHLERLFLREMYLIPLWYVTDVFLYSPRIRGMRQQPEFLFDGIAHWSITPEVK